MVFRISNKRLESRSLRNLIPRRYRDPEEVELREQVKGALAEAIREAGDGAQVVIIQKLEVNVNYASGGGATVNVKNA